MKRIRSFILVALLLTTLTGCGTQKVQDNDSKTNDTTATESTTEKVEDTTTSDTKNADSNAKQDSTNTKNADSDAKQDNTNAKQDSTNTKQDNTNGEDPTFYGTWEIKKVAGAAKISAGVNKDIIGLKIILSKDSATLGNKSYNNPKYKVAERTNNDIGKNTSISDMGSNSYYIEEISICNKENNADVMEILYKRTDDGALIYCFDGVYYEATKVS